MPDTYTTGKLGLIEPARGSYVDEWDSPLYANWQTLDAAVSGTTTLALSSSNVVLTVPTFPSYVNPPANSTSCQNLRLYLTGTISTNLTVFIPATVGGFWIVDNQTSGNYTVTVKTTASGSTGIAPRQSAATMVFSDGTNVYLADGGIVTQSVPSGAISAFGMAAAPNGWLLCNGSAVSRVTYASLFVAIGTVWGEGDGSTTFNVPNFENMFLRGTSATRTIGTYQADLYLNHTHALTDPGHLHIAGSYRAGSLSSGGAGDAPNTAPTTTSTTGITINTSTTGGTETRPKNYGVAFCIKT